MQEKSQSKRRHKDTLREVNKRPVKVGEAPDKTRKSSKPRSEEKPSHDSFYEFSPLMCFSIDKKGVVKDVNSIGAEHLGYTVGELLDKSVRTSQDITRHLDLAMLGAIPHTDDEEIPIDQVETAVRDKPRCMVAEAFRRIRTNLQFSAPAERQRSVVITSPQPEDGCALPHQAVRRGLAQAQRIERRKQEDDAVGEQQDHAVGDLRGT